MVITVTIPPGKEFPLDQVICFLKAYLPVGSAIHTSQVYEVTEEDKDNCPVYGEDNDSRT